MEGNLPGRQEIVNWVIGIAVVASGLVAFFRLIDLRSIVVLAVISAVVFLTRELGQRAAAEWMDAKVETSLSFEGSAISLAMAGLAFVSNLPIIALFPVESRYSGKRYEHWGKSIDVIWMKRQYWLASSGIVFLLLGWIISSLISLETTSKAFILFTLFQLMPFDYSGIPTGCLDGAYILRHSGFMWLSLTGFTILGVAVTLF